MNNEVIFVINYWMEGLYDKIYKNIYRPTQINSQQQINILATQQK